ncbi:hypothetical protein DMC18_19465 [Caulobacter sp. D5]|uniref:polysaccharide deacetylase family protein n=2 Tax=unclassified Caulobacter TaxID=2648921 RepID=UPI000D73BB67|nr:polysaccharide deacetylase family protein [Caulobacter sp. D5]PXA88301.1 hypothetical protein DMC18_19465 [Caulobacter sp. D5]
MFRRRLPLLLLVLAVLLAGGWWWWRERPDPSVMHVFPGVRGPAQASKIVEPPRTRIAQFDRGGPHRLAILVTDPQSGWLGLVRGFRAHGVPITVTQDPAKAMTHKVVLVYPIVSGRVLTAGQLRALAQHVRDGGTVLAFNLAGGGLGELFGVGPGTEASSRLRLRWSKTTGEPEADEIVVSSAGEAKVASVGYAPGTAQVAARFDDGSTAAACRQVGGQACVLGVDLGSLAQRSMNGRAEALARRYVNGYEPSLDSLFRWVRDLYVAGEPMPWLVSTAPAGKQVSILFTHDVDYGPSVRNALAYADALKARDIRGTFYVQTKYMKDYNDKVFFDEAAVADVKGLLARGQEVGSHTVAHSGAFEHTMSLGDGRERYPRYRPFVETVDTVRGASILGELRVSKFLLERLAGAQVVSFRPGRLAYPFTLPQALDASGYRYSSSITANTVLTHLPFQLTDGRADGALQPVFEFPVAIEDEAPPPLLQRLDSADALVARVARDRGVVTVLIHPNTIGDKLAFEAALADRWKGRAWMGATDRFGDWWSARDALELDVEPRGAGWTLTAAAPRAVSGVEILLPKASSKTVTLALPEGGRSTTAIP